MIGDYAFTHSSADIKLMQYVSAVGAMAHAPFLSSVAPAFFGIDSFTELPSIKDLPAVFLKGRPIPNGARYVSLKMRVISD